MPLDVVRLSPMLYEALDCCFHVRDSYQQGFRVLAVAILMLIGD